MIIFAGALATSIDVFFADDNGAAVTGKVAADFPACKWSGGINTASTAITLSDLALITTAHPNNDIAGGVKEREGGFYRLDLPNIMLIVPGRKQLTFAEVANKRIIVPAIECYGLTTALEPNNSIAIGSGGHVGIDWGNVDQPANPTTLSATSVGPDIYHADITFIRDQTNLKDEYVAIWFRNGVRVTGGITVPTINVVKRADGTDLIAVTAMTQIGTTGTYKFDASGASRQTAGESCVIIVQAIIDAATRDFARALGRDGT